MSDTPLELNARSDVDFFHEFEWADVDDSTNPPTVTPVDLTGYTAEMQIRKDARTAVALTLTSPASLTITALAGLVLVKITRAQLTTLIASSERYQYKTVLISADGTRYSLADGPLNIAAWP